jgi:malate dehydrogenase (oxaloacetate-decarboxylating)(NADP+)
MTTKDVTIKEKHTIAGFPTGINLLNDPSFNKGTAFTEEERDTLNLRGLLPPKMQSQAGQVMRVMENFRAKPDDLEKFIFMTGLQDRNETLFYRVVMENMDEMLPIIYTPTVGQACQRYGHIFRRARGLFVTAQDRGRMKSVLKNWPRDNVRVIVVTDGERILGLGDLGASGMGIPVGKLSLYVACAGLHPTQCLPVTLDVGTNNQSLREDPLYLGLGQDRLRGEAYDELVEEFIQAAQEIYPDALIQFEDFANRNAFPLLDRYQDKICCFNDDIQGTAAVTLAGVNSALRISGGKLTDQKILLLGAGEAGIGICDLMSAAMVAEGLPLEKAKERCWLVDSKALVVSERTGLNEGKRRYAHDHPPVTGFLEAVKVLEPTVILGVSGQPKTFTNEIVEEMARINERPIVFALSNPTSKAECSALEAYSWSEGRAIFASGSPFDPVQLNGKTFVPGQGNNAYIFPGVGLGVVACRSTRVTDEMFAIAAKTLADQVTESDLEQGRVYPPLMKIREVSLAIATAVAEIAYENGLAREPRPEDLTGAIQALMYKPKYSTYA